MSWNEQPLPQHHPTTTTENTAAKATCPEKDEQGAVGVGSDAWAITGGGGGGLRAGSGGWLFDLPVNHHHQYLLLRVMQDKQNS